MSTCTKPPRHEPDLTLRFWETPLPSVVVYRCTGQPMLLATWVTIATAEREDRALGRTPRSRGALASSLGLDEVALQPLVEYLLATNLLSSDPDGTLFVPWALLSMASLAYARHLQQQHMTTSTITSPAAHQEPLALE
jgi:hypothetical protein